MSKNGQNGSGHNGNGHLPGDPGDNGYGDRIRGHETGRVQDDENSAENHGEDHSENHGESHGESRDGYTANRPDHSRAAPPNILRFPDSRERQHRQPRKSTASAAAPGAARTPMINIPPVTKSMIAAFAGLHVLLHLIAPDLLGRAYENFAFIPGRYTGAAPFTVWAIAAPVTYAFLHGGWAHLALNSLMMAALGAGVERWLGGRSMIAMFLFCSLAGVLCQFLRSPQSLTPVVGASAGISGLFAAALVMIQRAGRGSQGRRGLLPFILFWIVISVAFGMTGAPDGSSVAWAAHIGGFLAGFLFLKRFLRVV